MKVIERATTPNGIKIQIEDWREDNTVEYPDLYGFTIAAYPTARTNSPNGWIQGGKEFRLDISANKYRGYSDNDVLSDYEKLKSGEKSLQDLAKHFHRPEHINYLI